MPSIIDEALFSEPSGRPITLVHFAGALVFVSLSLYVWSVGDTGPRAWMLVMASGSAVAGIAESLPVTRQQTAGVLRIVAILTFLSLTAASIAAPELVLG